MFLPAEKVSTSVLANIFANVFASRKVSISVLANIFANVFSSGKCFYLCTYLVCIFVHVFADGGGLDLCYPQMVYPELLLYRY